MYDTAIIEINSDTYGLYWMECVGVVDFLDLIRIKQVWLSKFHPTYHFQSLLMHTLHDHRDAQGKDMHAGRVAIFVASERCNLAWDYRASKYGQQVGGRKRKLPIAYSEKIIAKWQNSLPQGMLVPEWLTKCRTLDDVIQADKIANPSPCKLCGAPV